MPTSPDAPPARRGRSRSRFANLVLGILFAGFVPSLIGCGGMSRAVRPGPRSDVALGPVDSPIYRGRRDARPERRIAPDLDSPSFLAAAPAPPSRTFEADAPRSRPPGVAVVGDGFGRETSASAEPRSPAPDPSRQPAAASVVPMREPPDPEYLALAREAPPLPPDLRIPPDRVPNSPNPGPATTPAVDPEAAALAQLGELLQRGERTLAGVRDYQVAMVYLPKGKNAEETLRLSKRRKPLAIRMEWLDGPTKGREVIYDEVKFGGKIQVHMPRGLLTRLSLDPNNPIVRASSRHPIQEAGFESILEDLKDKRDRQARGDYSLGRLEDLGLRSDPAGRDLRQFARRDPAGVHWIVGVDPQSGLPLYLEEQDSQRRPVERFLFKDYRANVSELAADAAFDPDVRWTSGFGF